MRVEFERSDVAPIWVVVTEMGAGEIKGPLENGAATRPVTIAIELLARRETRAT